MIAACELKPQVVGLTKLGWWLAFALATVSLSVVFQSFKAFTLSPTGDSALFLAGALLLTTLALVVLVYDGYAKDKLKGKVKKPFKAFDWLYTRQLGQETTLRGMNETDEANEGGPGCSK